jgi:hypothetical protein
MLFAIVISIEILTSKLLITKMNLTIPSKPTYLAFGHSHSQCAIDDSLIQHMKNLSDAGEAYFYTLQKTGAFIDQNPSVSIVFIEFANNQISSQMDE